MTQRAIVCPHCRQVNLRSSGSRVEQLTTNPRYPELCTLCRTNLQSGQRAAIDIPAAWIMWFGTYMIHALVLMGLCSFPIWFFALLTYQFQQLFGLLAVTSVVGLTLGLAIAEQKRRRGKLLHQPKQHG